MPEELNEKEQLLNTFNFNFLSNNVKGLQSSKKRLKLFQFFKNKISSKVSCFYKKRLLWMSRKKYGVINLVATYIFDRGKQILVVF